MIKSERVNASLDNIYGEVIHLAVSIGECQSSIDHLEDIMNRSHNDIKECLLRIEKRLDSLDDKTREQEKKSGYLHQIFQFSLSNVFKWILCFITVGMMLGSGAKVNTIFSQAIGYLTH